MMNNEKRAFAEMIRCGEILANILPKKYKDYKSAEKCYMEAVEKQPRNSKINHKLGVLYFLSDELFNMEKSLKYLRLAVKQEVTNFSAGMDLIHTLLGAPQDNGEEIKKLVTLLGEKSAKSAKDKQQLDFVKGLLCFMLGDAVKAVEKWICAYKCSPTDELFSRVWVTSKRHRWDTNLLNFARISAALENYLRKEPDDAETVVRLLEFVPQPPTASASPKMSNEGKYVPPNRRR